MIHPETHAIQPEDRKNGQGGPNCFYCKGESVHDPDCVMRDRTVVIRTTFEYTVTVPENWTKENIEFHRNESSWCQGNAIHELAALIKEPEAGEEERFTPCGCLGKTEYVREATEADEYRLTPLHSKRLALKAVGEKA